ncbi:MAG TPA: hypothetical protein VKJ47_25105 [Candidatus Binatia bacterium]|nr:hypothetical protein [Candidatus Binatia bacterium]
MESMPAPRRALATLALLIATGAILMPLGGCEDTSVSLGYGLPRNDFCRAAAEQPGKPINSDCLDSIGH